MTKHNAMVQVEVVIAQTLNAVRASRELANGAKCQLSQSQKAMATLLVQDAATRREMAYLVGRRSS